MSSPMPSPIRLSPQISNLQQNSPYLDIYTNAPISPLRTQENTQHLRQTLPLSHPEPKRWESPGAWGARHINDSAPFTLWDEVNRKFHHPTREQSAWIRRKFGDGTLSHNGWLMRIETASPPQPIPFTLGAMPVLFVPPGGPFEEPIPSAPYPNPRLPDPCPGVHWPRMVNPTKRDGRSYPELSLPGTVGGRTALYHHQNIPFFKSMRSLPRPRIIQPSKASSLSPAVHDTANYLRRSALTPGCRVESGFEVPSPGSQPTPAATTCGVKIRNNGGEERLTVANHEFLSSKDIYHPQVNGGDLIGQVVDTRPELDVALVKLTPAASFSFTNTCYFQAEPRTRLLESAHIGQGSWSEIDGMSSGLFSMMNTGIMELRPIRPVGHPMIPFSQWDTRLVNLVFGNIEGFVSDGVCGAPIVEVESGGVAGFFHLSDGSFATSAVLDDLVAEGWGLV
ncbi:hypothetical protein E8E15_008885 [Penicillium rubens]|uniref:uncharacterized protein n=1 Tax=Penicillium rubens TaxID=1108849 RepID=UPI001D69969F|nr:uncharacterized protein N7525_007642 [Penicillium rubens]KAF3027768.1 hypothetical protein E8E15_008885 [Penicillium rubens]KAJ5829389.1 hypothetical protein N7525_007642 [Penicillium rubens]KAJ5841046.1 hypothetical protein N7534_010876 [Penicillium rubens]